MTKLFHTLVLLTFALLGLGVPAQAASFDECLVVIIDTDLEAKQTFQTDLAAFVIQQDSEFLTLAELNRDLQIALAQSRRANLMYLLTTDPGRPVIDQGISRFMNFDWTEQDDNAQKASDPEYQQLSDRITELKRQNIKHPDWPKMRRFFKDTLTKLPAFQQILDTIQGSRKVGDEALLECKSKE